MTSDRIITAISMMLRTNAKVDTLNSTRLQFGALMRMKKDNNNQMNEEAQSEDGESTKKKCLHTRQMTG